MWGRKKNNPPDDKLNELLEAEFPIGRWHLFCRTCECAYPVTAAQLRERLTREHECPACEVATALVDSLSASRRDHYLAYLHYEEHSDAEEQTR